MELFNTNSKPRTVNMMYGADGKLRTAMVADAKTAKKNVKSFNNELTKYDKDFLAYASMDIDATQINDRSTQYILGKLNIANDYVSYVSDDDMASQLGDENVAIAGNRSAQKIGVGAKIAGVMQPFFEKQAQKHPMLQGLSDRITKAANNGRMPLTAESAAMMKIAFDKKYYNDCRKPGADMEALREQYNMATQNLKTMAAFDGIGEKQLSDAISKKIYTQMKVDESITDIYKGMSNGNVCLAPDTPKLDKDGKPVVIKGKPVMLPSTSFVGSDKEPINAFDLEPREPQTTDEIIADYQDHLSRVAANCKSPADIKRMLASDVYRNIERNAKSFAQADCIGDAAEFKHDFARANIEVIKNWAVENSPNSPYAKLVVPDKYDDSHDSGFADAYSTDDYDDSKTAVSDGAKEQVQTMSDKQLDESLQQDVKDAADDCSKESVAEKINEAKEQTGVTETKRTNITLNRDKLLTAEDESTYTVKIPGTQGKQFMKLDKSKCVELDDGKTIGAYVKRSEQYNKLDDTGAIIETCKGTDILKNFDSRKRTVVPSLDSEPVVVNPTEPSKSFRDKAATVAAFAAGAFTSAKAFVNDVRERQGLSVEQLREQTKAQALAQYNSTGKTIINSKALDELETKQRMAIEMKVDETPVTPYNGTDLPDTKSKRINALPDKVYDGVSKDDGVIVLSDTAYEEIPVVDAIVEKPIIIESLDGVLTDKPIVTEKPIVVEPAVELPAEKSSAAKTDVADTKRYDDTLTDATLNGASLVNDEAELSAER